MDIMLKYLISRLLIALASILVALLLLEVAVRLILPVSDSPRYQWYSDDQTYRFAPNQTGQWVKGLDGYVNATYRINSQGWNAPFDYVPEKSPDVTRIAIIGDSFVEALQVDYPNSFMSVLEHTLEEETAAEFEVYSFGQSGAPLSQYLHLMRQITPRYHPDIVIIVLVANDFYESITTFAYKPYFQQYQVNMLNQITETVPQNAGTNTGPVFDFLRRVALVRLMVRNLDINSVDQLKFRLGLQETSVPNSLDSPPPLQDDITTAVSYSFQAYQNLAETEGTRLLLVANVIPGIFYDPSEPKTVGIQEGYLYNELVNQVASDMNIPLVDLTVPFEEAFRANQQVLCFCPGDGHWNERGHRVVGQEIVDYLLSREWVAN